MVPSVCVAKEYQVMGKESTGLNALFL